MTRINRTIELLTDDDQPVYYMGSHTGHVLTQAQGQQDADTWPTTSTSVWSTAPST